MEFFKKYGDWRGDRKLPANFILFFFLAFFFLGEQLVALPIYLFGPVGDGADKVAILDLALSDAIHRPLFYFLFSFISWMLFRLFRWPLVWIGAWTLWLVFKYFFPDPGHAQNLIGTLIGVGFFLLVPYFIYRIIDRKWGAAGSQKALWILMAANILFLGFFAYQIYGLHHSYRGRVSYESLRDESSNGQNLPSYSCPDGIEYRKDLSTLVVENGAKREVAANEQNWIEQNCDL